MLFIAEVCYGDWHGRLHLEWGGNGNSNAEFVRTMKLVEEEIGPNATSLDVFIGGVRRAFLKAGFVAIRR